MTGWVIFKLFLASLIGVSWIIIIMVITMVLLKRRAIMVSMKRGAQPSKRRKITGGTNIFGRCIEVGGKEPKAVIQLHGDQSNLLVKLTKELAKPLGRRLYEDVVIEGNAVWDAETLELLEFEATEISMYRGGNVVTAFKELAKAAGGRWDNVDAQEYVRELRDAEEDGNEKGSG